MFPVDNHSSSKTGPTFRNAQYTDSVENAGFTAHGLVSLFDQLRRSRVPSSFGRSNSVAVPFIARIRSYELATHFERKKKSQ